MEPPRGGRTGGINFAFEKLASAKWRGLKTDSSSTLWLFVYISDVNDKNSAIAEMARVFSFNSDRGQSKTASMTHGWLGGRVVSLPDSGSEEHGFESQSRRCRVSLGQTVRTQCA